ncbi:short-chain dehydrogenase [Ventosimonas gracilis]|uniref:Short-chain dehydrogenase n=1 Tax=Ventosimonas gracilis TaxID=1680762 RepID=A0A139SLU0_9GAMM|nr:SDR family oxidoreductase [Ventosimonas gracilis]KXU35515.1 short-chain dehydrogenase [Ventosimonas gracilis]
MPSVLISGCSSGIGRALAEAFKGAGWQVFASAPKTADVTALEQAGFTAMPLNVTDEQSIAAVFTRLQAEKVTLDVLINNAGYAQMGPLLDIGSQGILEQMHTNVAGLIGLTRALFPLLRQSRGLVVNISSVSGVLVTPFAGAYCASKAAVHALSIALRMELAPFGVSLMEVQPGAVTSQISVNAARQVERLVPPHSLWSPLRSAITARVQASQQFAQPADVFACQLLAVIQRKRRPRLLRLGKGGWTLPLMAHLLPQALLERLLKRRFGLHRPL